MGFGRAANSRDAGIHFAVERKEVPFFAEHFELRFKFESQSSPDAWYVRAHVLSQFYNAASNGGAGNTSCNDYDGGLKFDS